MYTARMLRRKFPGTLVAFLLAIALLNWLAGYYSWYWTMRWFDMPMHFAGGMWIAGVAIWWRFFSGKFSGEIPQNFARAVLWGVGAAFIVGLGWEIYESTVSFFVEGHINDILDTMSDLVFDLLGGLIFAFLVYEREKMVTLNYETAFRWSFLRGWVRKRSFRKAGARRREAGSRNFPAGKYL